MGGLDKSEKAKQPKDTKPVTSVNYPDELMDIKAIPRGTCLRGWFDDGVRVVVLRSNLSMNVYLGVPDSHPLAGHDYDALPLDCHGGLTFCEKGDGKYLPKGYYWYGYDYAHAGDYAWYDGGTPDFMGNDKKWTLGEIVKDAWNPTYEFRKLMGLAENIANKARAN